MSNEMIFDNAGKPSMMVRIPKFKVSDVIAGGREETHPAFIVDGREVPEIYIGKYQSVIVNGLAYSIAFQQPTVNATFNDMVQASEAKGDGWHLMTNAERAAIALWSMKNGTLPHGNNNFGSDYQHADESGICFDGRKVLTGSGPATWSHDHTPEGIFDMNGNVFEWLGGLRLHNGEIQIIPDNNAAKHIDQSETSGEWKPIMVGKNKINISETARGLKLTTEEAEGDWNGCRFARLETDIEIPNILKELALYPSGDEKIKDYFGAGVKGIRYPIYGGSWDGGAVDGLFALYLSYVSGYSYTFVGGRLAYYNV